jgi:proteasome lid subunit RPN8/RPN11
MTWPDESSLLRLTQETLDAIVVHCLDAYPEEGCGLLVGDPTNARVVDAFPARNLAASARVYEVDPKDFLRTDREAEQRGLEVIGVYHSHTHTDPFPSPTDIEQAVDPSWHYVIVSLRQDVAATRSYRIADGRVEEELIEVTGTADPNR